MFLGPSSSASPCHYIRFALLALGLIGAWGCQSEYDVRVRVSAADLGDIVRTQVAVVPTCSTQELGGAPMSTVRLVEFAPGEAVPALGELMPGDYGLYARAMNAQCQVVAAGCTPIVVERGGGGQLAVDMSSLSPAAFCDVSRTCVQGACAGFDAGSPDAGQDAGVSDALPDAPAVDAPQDAAIDAVDASAGDAGTESCEDRAGEAGWELCNDDAGCAVIFRDGTGCPEVCRQLGLTCAQSYEDELGACDYQRDLPALECADTGHSSDYCECEAP
ncbi:MAG: hypothetical protein AB8H86_32640 [Polyangiales bacterium]